MARIALTPQTTIGSTPSLPLAADSADFVWTAADNVNGNDVPHTGRELVLVRNDNAGAQTVTVTSVADPFNRTGDITTYSVGIGEYAVLGPFDLAGWKQADGKLWLDASAADVFFAILRLP